MIKRQLDALIKELEELDTKVYTEVSVARVEKALEKQRQSVKTKMPVKQK